MIAEILTVGTEIVLGDILNSNTHYISKQLANLGVDVYFHTTVGDNYSRFKETLHLAINRSDVVILTGGLGPTDDDLTREVVADVLDEKLYYHEEVYNKMLDFLNIKNKGIQLTENNKKQAYVFENGVVLHNEFGTAPGLYIEKNNKLVILLPGVPREMKFLWKTYIVDLLKSKLDEVIYSKFVYTYGITESLLEHELQHFLHTQTNPTIALYAKLGEVMIRVTAKGTSRKQCEELVNKTILEMKCINNFVYLISETYHDESPMLMVAFQKLKEKSLTISFAESITAGMLSSYFASIPTASAVLKGGIVVYNNEMKEKLLHVDHRILEKYSEFSTQCVEVLAKNAHNLMNSDITIATSGVAGPGNFGSHRAGDVYIGYHFKGKTGSVFRNFSGDRNAVRKKVCLAVFALILKLIDNCEK